MGLAYLSSDIGKRPFFLIVREIKGLAISSHRKSGQAVKRAVEKPKLAFLLHQEREKRCEETSSFAFLLLEANRMLRLAFFFVRPAGRTHKKRPPARAAFLRGGIIYLG
jgi:hypothetical protein